LLDGVNYRVTLDKNGGPLLYETIHNCGCYYEAYPNHRLKIREKIDYAEPPLILKAPELTPSKELMTVAMECRTHYVQHLYPLAREPQLETVVYSFADYGELRSLPDSKDGRRSMFSQDSLAFGSERLERLILWSTGVVSPVPCVSGDDMPWPSWASGILTIHLHWKKCSPKLIPNEDKSGKAWSIIDRAKL
jgi:hypothetical protein